MIPDEAVEAAAKAFFGTALSKWEDIGPLTQKAYRRKAYAALESALPHLSEAAKQPQRTSPTDWPDVPRRQ